MAIPWGDWNEPNDLRGQTLVDSNEDEWKVVRFVERSNKQDDVFVTYELTRPGKTEPEEFKISEASKGVEVRSVQDDELVPELAHKDTYVK